MGADSQLVMRCVSWTSVNLNSPFFLLCKSAPTHCQFSVQRAMTNQQRSLFYLDTMWLVHKGSWPPHSGPHGEMTDELLDPSSISIIIVIVTIFTAPSSVCRPLSGRLDQPSGSFVSGGLCLGVVRLRPLPVSSLLSLCSSVSLSCSLPVACPEAWNALQGIDSDRTVRRPHRESQ